MRLSLIVWGAWLGIFLALELPAAFHDVPWMTLSSTSWRAETWWEPVRLILEAFLIVLLLHICYRLSATALIATVCVAAVAVIVHLLGA
jgi:hypothetical protein